MFHKILVAIDTSKMNEHVFNEAVLLAKMTGASLMLLHVLSTEEEGSPNIPILPGWEFYLATGVNGEILESYQEQWKEFEQQGQELLQSLQQQATNTGVRAEFSQTAGSPGRTICDFARNWGADLIVTGRRGHSRLSELFLGSVSNYVLHHAPCSVLAVQHAVVANDGEHN